jgi:6-phosphogluconolactonase (cycloisomerase 2 family)
MVFNQSGTMAYLLNELKSRIDVFKIMGDKFERTQSIDADKIKGDNASADIHISPDGKWLLTSNRITSNEITVFNILDNGTLKKIYHQPVAKTPRNFSFDPTGKYVLVASQDESKIQVFSFDTQSGMMTDTKKDIQVEMPVCIQFRKVEKEVDAEEPEQDITQDLDAMKAAAGVPVTTTAPKNAYTESLRIAAGLK